MFVPMGYYIDRGTIASYKTMIDSLTSGDAFNLVNMPFVYEGKAAWTSYLYLCAAKNIYVLTQLDYGEVFTGQYWSSWILRPYTSGRLLIFPPQLSSLILQEVHGKQTDLLN